MCSDTAAYCCPTTYLDPQSVGFARSTWDHDLSHNPGWYWGLTRTVHPPLLTPQGDDSHLVGRWQCCQVGDLHTSNEGLWVHFTNTVYETNISGGTDLWALCHCPWPQKQIAPHGMWRHPLPLCCHRSCTAHAHPSWSEQRSHGQAEQEVAPHYRPTSLNGSGVLCCVLHIPALAAVIAAVMAQGPVVAPAT